MTFEISARGRSCSPWSVNFLGFFLAACSNVFRKASLNLLKEQVSRLARSAIVQYATVFRLILAKRVKHWSRAWDGKVSYCELWCGGDESLASKSSFQGSKLFGESKIDADFWPGQTLNKNLFWRPASMCLFQKGSSTSGILYILTVSAKFTCDDLCGESESC